MRPQKPKNKTKYRTLFMHNGVRHTLTLDETKSLSDYMCTCIERIIKFKQAGIPLTIDLLDFLKNNSYIQNKLEEWEILEVSQNKKYTIPILIEQQIAENLRITEKRKKELAQPIKKMAKYCNTLYPEELSLIKIEGYLRSIINNGLSSRTYNKHLQIIKQFMTWLEIKGYTSIDLRGIKKLNENNDKRHKRRVLTYIEIKALLNDIHGKHHGLTCEERKIIYLFGLEAGFRWNEIVTLSVGDIDLKEKIAFIKPENEKSRRGAEQPLPQILYSMLCKYLKSPLRLPSCRLFENMWKDKGANMLRKDLDEIGIDWRENNKGEVIDFHALRHTFGTMHARAGTPIQKLKKLMRHSTINLTNKYYVHLETEDLRSYMNVLPSLIG